VVHILSLINAVAVQLPAVGTAEAWDFLEEHLLVQRVYDDLVGMVDGGSHPLCITSALPPTPQSYPWGLQTIAVPAVHPQWQGSGVTVAVLDTGIDVSHPELWPRIIGGYNARAGEVLYVDDNGHGTHMAGIIAADLQNSVPDVNNPPSGIIGVAP
jgi:hypothetical protein